MGGLFALSPILPRFLSPTDTLWEDALSAVGDGEVEWLSDHQARVRVRRGERAHQITLYAYDRGVHLVGVVAAIDDLWFRRAQDGHLNPSALQDWALDETNDLTLGYLNAHPRDGLTFGVHAIHGSLSEEGRRRLVEEVAWRADTWEAALTGADRW